MQKILQIDVLAFVRHSKIHTLLVQYDRRRLRMSILMFLLQTVCGRQRRGGNISCTAKISSAIVTGIIVDAITMRPLLYRAHNTFFLGSYVPWKMHPCTMRPLLMCGPHTCGLGPPYFRRKFVIFLNQIRQNPYFS
jgi:hypothetical protein